MIKKIFVRLFVACAAVVGLVVTAACVVGYLAFQTPSFYTELCKQEYSSDAQDASRLQLELAEANLNRWLQQSIVAQKSGGNEAAPLAVLIGGVQEPYDPTEDTFVVRVTDEQLNAQLAAAESSNSDMQQPRIRFSQDQADFAVRMATPELECVLSTTLKPKLTGDGKLRLEITTIRVGNLPLPLKTILGWLPVNVARAAGDVQLDLTGAAPQVIVDLPHRGPDSPTVHSITCSNGEIAVEFLPPILKQEAEDQLARAERKALVRRNASPAAHGQGRIGRQRSTHGAPSPCELPLRPIMPGIT